MPGPSPATPVTGGRVRFNTGTHDVAVNESFISPLVEIYGEVEIGRRGFIASNTILYAGEGQVLSLGDETNCQDNAYLLAIAAANTFGTMVMHNTTVAGVVIPPNRITPVGVQLTAQADADDLPEVTEDNDDFKHAVQHVNVEFAAGYTALFEQFGRGAVEGVSPNPITSFTPTSIAPTLDDGVVLAELVRIVGDVRLGEESTVGQRTAIRADEGTPIVIGRRARIGSRVTFHALEHTSLQVGDHARIGNEAVIHGPLIVGNHVIVEDEAVVFQATVEDHVTIGRGATVAGAVTIREGAIVPVGAVVTTQDEADALPFS